MSEIHFEHKPVLFKETIESLNIDPEGTYIDGTAGGGGHSGAILQRLTTGTLLFHRPRPGRHCRCERAVR